MYYLIIAIIIFAFLAVGYLIGYASAARKLEKEIDGFLHIVEDPDDGDNYIFLEVVNAETIDALKNNDYANLKVQYDSARR